MSIKQSINILESFQKDSKQRTTIIEAIGVLVRYAKIDRDIELEKSDYKKYKQFRKQLKS